MKRHFAIMLLSLAAFATSSASTDSYIYWQVYQDGANPIEFSYAKIKAVDVDSGESYYLSSETKDHEASVWANEELANGNGYSSEASYAYLNGYANSGYNYAIELYAWNGSKYDMVGQSTVGNYSALGQYITENNSMEIPSFAPDGSLASFGGAGSGVGFNAIPEPSCALLLIGGCIVLMSRHRKIA